MILRKTKGFTLIEIVVAIAILSIGIVAISEVFSVSLRSLRSTRDNMDLSILALSEMRSLLQSPEFDEGRGSVVREDYIVDTVIEEVDTERTEGLPYRFFNITLTVKKGQKVYTLWTQRLVKTIFK